MKIIIHRGTREIGGSCVEVSSGKTRLVVDFGMPLVNARREPFDPKVLVGKSIEDLKKLRVLPDIKGFYRGEKKTVDAILISHSHMDHYGLLRYVHPDIPIYLSAGAKALIEISEMFVPHKIGAMNARVIEKHKKTEIGDVAVTPYLVDHSAFDALAFLIEGDGKRLFYSGDFRGHGRKSSLFKRMTARPPRNIDCLLMEGSMLGRGKQKYPDENAVQARMEEILREKNDIAFLFASSQNIDRIVSAYKACLRTGTIFVIDLYTAYILERLKEVSVKLPQFNWKNMRVKYSKNHADTLARKVSVNVLYRYKASKIEKEDVSSKRAKILMLARNNSLFPGMLKNLPRHEGVKVLFSMWDGYLTKEFKGLCETEGLVVESVHTSGHAVPEDLKAFAEAVAPKMLVPIHTFHGKDYPGLFRNVKVLDDGQMWEVPA